MEYDFAVVGAGLAGSTFALQMANKGARVLVVDQRGHIGGNCHDYTNEFGVLVHKYGPHYFRTDNQRVLEFLSKFTEWHPHRYNVRSCVDGKLFDFPLNLNTLQQYFGGSFTEESAKLWLAKIAEPLQGEPKNAEEYLLSKIGRELYEFFYKEYTTKQWGVSPELLPVHVVSRIPIRFDNCPDYVVGGFQAVPEDGYTAMIRRMLDHPNTTVRLNHIAHPSLVDEAHRLVVTGSLDKFFNYPYGTLPYRSLRFEFVTFPQEFVQLCEQYNYPSLSYKYTRVVEIKHVTGQSCPNTTVSVEYPQSVGDPYYPIETDDNLSLHRSYVAWADYNNILVLGRLGMYKYMNMDQVVDAALQLSDKI